MTFHLLQPLICERFRTEERYREGHLRVVNALPERRVVGLHSPEIKQVAKCVTRRIWLDLCPMSPSYIIDIGKSKKLVKT